eukprot:CAMPEP_0196776978 /NCGR_PEP_ID=MMETSP1104-20130614/4945_1 /TAXON_ID=33652 /ORGANISM="Cafeteria sp., Strain Caron Lab Isolate" /LENGTH=838 /DNA_ID=CAMNT_0042147145 /DNA_START=53 /DNA_END=2565 /DNA_ORIENTATION=-
MNANEAYAGVGNEFHIAALRPGASPEGAKERAVAKLGHATFAGGSWRPSARSGDVNGDQDTLSSGYHPRATAQGAVTAAMAELRVGGPARPVGRPVTVSEVVQPTPSSGGDHVAHEQFDDRRGGGGGVSPRTVEVRRGRVAPALAAGEAESVSVPQARDGSPRGSNGMAASLRTVSASLPSEPAPVERGMSLIHASPTSALVSPPGACQGDQATALPALSPRSGTPRSLGGPPSVALSQETPPLAASTRANPVPVADVRAHGARSRRLPPLRAQPMLSDCGDDSSVATDWEGSDDGTICSTEQEADAAEVLGGEETDADADSSLRAAASRLWGMVHRRDAAGDRAQVAVLAPQRGEARGSKAPAPATTAAAPAAAPAPAKRAGPSSSVARGGCPAPGSPTIGTPCRPARDGSDVFETADERLYVHVPLPAPHRLRSNSGSGTHYRPLPGPNPRVGSGSGIRSRSRSVNEDFSSGSGSGSGSEFGTGSPAPSANTASGSILSAATASARSTPPRTLTQLTWPRPPHMALAGLAGVAPPTQCVTWITRRELASFSARALLHLLIRASVPVGQGGDGGEASDLEGWVADLDEAFGSDEEEWDDEEEGNRGGRGRTGKAPMGRAVGTATGTATGTGTESGRGRSTSSTRCAFTAFLDTLRADMSGATLRRVLRRVIAQGRALTAAASRGDGDGDGGIAATSSSSSVRSGCPSASGSGSGIRSAPDSRGGQRERSRGGSREGSGDPSPEAQEGEDVSPPLRGTIGPPASSPTAGQPRGVAFADLRALPGAVGSLSGARLLPPPLSMRTLRTASMDASPLSVAASASTNGASASVPTSGFGTPG